MKRFLSQISFFTLLLLSYFCLNLGVNFFIYKNQKIDIDKRILILGDSHSKRGINPDILGSADNVSQSGEPYYISFWKLKKILLDNSETIDTLILSFAPHNIGAFNDFKLSDERWSGEMFKRIYPIQNLSELKGVDIDFLKYYKILWKETGFYPKRNHINYKGAYFNSNTIRDSDLETTINRHYFLNSKPLEVSKVSLSYLDSIINLCRSYKVTPILVSSPVHSSYYNNIPKNILNEYLELNETFSNKGIKVINKTNTVYPDSLYLDKDHLNEIGATRFTKELRKNLSSAQ